MATNSNRLTLDDNSLTDTAGASQLLGIPTSTLVKWRCTGENDIPYVKIGKGVKYYIPDLKNYVLRHRKGISAWT